MLIGVVGKPNVGKSTFFKALTLADVLIANYPFASIEPNKGFGFVRTDCVEKFFKTKCNPRFGYCINGQRFVPVEAIDVAGLVPGAHEGKGMGNQFLDDLRQADILIHVVDASGSVNERGEPVEPGSYDPLFDVKFLEVEIDMWYLSVIKKGWEKFSRQVQQEHGNVSMLLAKQLSGLNATEPMVADAMKKLALNPEKPAEWTGENLHQLAVELRKKTKPMIIAANKADVSTAEKNIIRLKESFPDYLIVPCSAECEVALKEASKKEMIKYIPGDKNFSIVGKPSEAQKKGLEFIQKNVLDKLGSTGVQQVLNSAVFDFLKFIAIFPGGVNKLGDQYGNILPDCFLLPNK
ncbi:MAG: redox-regulated ATPase YchF, partial [Nanoarchaeota archaeon]